MSDDDRQLPDSDAEEVEEQLPAEQPRPEAESDTVSELPTIVRAERWRGGGGPGRRLTMGCAAAVLALVVVLVVGVSLTKRSVSLAVERAKLRVKEHAEQLPDQKLRTARNLDRFSTQLAIARDPYPMMGEFLKRVREALADDDLDRQELEEINRYLESTFPTGGGVVEP